MQQEQDFLSIDSSQDTGPIEIPMQRPRRFSLNPLNWIPKSSAPAQTITRAPAPVREPDSDFIRQRQQIEQFSEDYLPLGKRALHSIARFVGYVLPFLAVVAVGSDLGQFYAPGLGAFSSYLLAYGIECAIAALTVMIGSAAASTERGTAHSVKLGVTFLAWLVLSGGSALSLYVMATSVMSSSITGILWYVTIGWRVASVACFDVASVCILFWSGRSLARYLDELSKKMHAITASNEAELNIQRAQQSARLRQQEDAAYMQSRENHEAFTRELQEIANRAILESARANLSIRAISEETGGRTTDRRPLQHNSGNIRRGASAHRAPLAGSEQTKK